MRSRRHSVLLDLLAYAAGHSSSVQVFPAERHEDIDRQLRWLSTAGLAPLLYRAARENIEQMDAAHRKLLLSAHLTAIAWHGNLIDATREIVAACEAEAIRLTLLKGISISDQYYPDPHLRPMGDIDVLVAAPARASAEAIVLRLGYRRQPHYEHGEGAHHGAPLYHPERRVWVEVHGALFPEDATVRSGRLFSPVHVAAQTVSSMFHGRTVNRLTDELQLVYIASSWIRDLASSGIRASFVPSLFDAVYLLRAKARTLNWDQLLSWLDNPMAVASLHVMLSYLCRNGLHHVDPPILYRLATGQEVIGPLVLRLLHAMLDKYLVDGRPFSRFARDWHASIALSTLLAPGPSGRKLALVPWNIIFPPSVAERYSVRYQFGRIAKALRAKG